MDLEKLQHELFLLQERVSELERKLNEKQVYKDPFKGEAQLLYEHNSWMRDDAN